MTLPPTRGWRIDLAIWAPLLIFGTGFLCMKSMPLMTLPTVLALLWAAPPVGYLADKLSLNAYAFHPLRQGKRLLADITKTVMVCCFLTRLQWGQRGLAALLMIMV